MQLDLQKAPGPVNKTFKSLGLFKRSVRRWQARDGEAERRRLRLVGREEHQLGGLMTEAALE
jgi:hypothetical protein